MRGGDRNDGFSGEFVGDQGRADAGERKDRRRADSREKEMWRNLGGLATCAQRNPAEFRLDPVHPLARLCVNLKSNFERPPYDKPNAILE
jgi:hypothetical protein